MNPSRILSLLALLLGLAASASPVRADDKALATPNPNRIHWEMNTLDAFVKAVEEVKPMVVVFLAPKEFRNEKGGNLSNDFQAVLDSKELLAFKDRAIFAKGFAHEDEYARRMASHLKLTVYPTISVIAPRTDQLTETFRMEGFFKIEEVVSDLNLALPKAKTAEPGKKSSGNAKEVKPQSAAQHDGTKGEAASFPEADRKAIEQAVSAYEAAFKTGNLDQFLKLTSEHDKTKLRFSLRTLAKVGDAKQLILVAMDNKWGRKDDSIPYGADDEKLQKRMMRVETLKLHSIENPGKMSATLYVEARLTTGKTESWKVFTSKQSDQWKLWIHSSDSQQALILTREAESTLDKLAGLYQGIARDVLNGKYSSREAVKQAAFRAFQSVSLQENPYELQGNKDDTANDDQAKRLAIANGIKMFSKDDNSPTTTAPVIVKQNDEKKPLSDSDKKAIQEVVAQYGAALKAGDFKQIVNLTSGPFNSLYEEGFTLAQAVGEAKGKLKEAMDRQYGKKPVLLFGTDDYSLRRQMKYLSSLTVLDFDTAIGKVVTLNVDAKLTSGAAEKWKFVAYRFGDTWRIWPRQASVLIALGTTQRWQDQMKALIKAYDALVADILAGKYPTREAAYEAGYAVYAKITGEDNSELKLKIDPKLFGGIDTPNKISPELLKRLEDARKQKTASNSTITESQNKITEIRKTKPSEQKSEGDDELTKAQDAIKQLHAIYTEGTKLMNQATDEASARKIKPRFMELDKQFEETGKTLRSLKLSSDQQKGLMLMFQEKMEPAKESFGAAYRQLLTERPAAYRVLADAELIKVGEANMEAIAQSNVLSIKQAITVYYQANRQWPSSLESLKKFHDGSLTDPWGKPYQFEIVNVTGDKEAEKYQPYVWTISQFGDGKKVIGQMPSKK